MNLRRKLFSRFHLLCTLASALLATAFVRADELQLLWQKSPADGVPYLIAPGDRERGVAYNPATGHILVVSRASVPGGEIYILDGQTGEQIGFLNLGSDGTVGGGTFGLSTIAIADDGVIYAANLTTSTAAPDFRIYRWENEATEQPTLAYSGDPSGDASAPRWGDSFDVRGSGANTQFIAGAGNTATVGALFTTTDGLTFTPTIISNIAATSVAFGAGNTVWTKRSGAALRQIGFDPATGAGTVLLTVPTSVVLNTAGPIGVNAASNYLAAITINTGTDDLRLFDISVTNDFLIIGKEEFPANNPNGNAAGFVDITGDILSAINANNGLMVFRILKTASPPSFLTQPAAITFVEGGFGSLVANVSGTRPISYQWQLNGANLPRGTNATLSFTNITAAEAGTYTLIASNAASAVTSSPAEVTVTPSVRSDRATRLFALAPGSRPYLNQDNTDRGVAYNAASNHVLVVTRVPPVQIFVLDGDTGADLWTLQTPVEVIPTGASTPGGFRLNMIGVADDGVIYAANLTTGAGETDANAYRIYRWENDSPDTVPVEVYRGAPAPGRRLGDSFAVRGAGNDTQILLGSFNSAATEPDNVAVLMTTPDAGMTWTPTVITTLGVDDDAARTGIGFASTNSFWAKYGNQPLRLISFDAATGEGTLLQSFEVAGGTAVAGSSNLVAVLVLENPDNVRLFELNSAGDQITLIDQEFFATDNVNGNGTGSLDFGNDRLYALDTNNGLIALKLSEGGSTAPGAATFSSVSGTPTTLAFTLTGTPGATYRLESTTDFNDWTLVQTVQIEPDGSTSVTLNTTGDFKFYRAVAQ